MRQAYYEIESVEMLCNLTITTRILRHCAFQNINFTEVFPSIACKYEDCIFLGCTIPDAMRINIAPSCIELPSLAVPFKTFPATLYTAATLYAGYNPADDASLQQSYDMRVYHHYKEQGATPCDICETLARSLHDHSISDALHDMLQRYNEKYVVAVMGGHSMARNTAEYRKVARISKHLTEQGRLMVSGGGPGAMEATHLGAYMAGYADADLDDAIAMLSSAPRYEDTGWLSKAFAVMQRYARHKAYSSIGVPTWLYGHEPATPFASHIAKYFDNSIREDGILSIAKGGVIYAPGSAGTLQEIFQDAAQNHYTTHGYASPMVFMGVTYWTQEVPAYNLIQMLKAKGRYKNLLLSLTDSETDVENTIKTFGDEE